MNHLRNFRWVLAILTIASLVVAPLSRPAMAATSSAVAQPAAAPVVSSHAMADHDMSGRTMTHHMMSVAQSGDDVAVLPIAGLLIVDRPAANAAHEMPCCPSQAPMAPDCDKCLYMALCLAKYLAGLPSSIAQPMLPVSTSLLTLRNEAWPEGLGHPPPEHPPRHRV
jgi:hypothetical protein